MVISLPLPLHPPTRHCEAMGPRSAGRTGEKQRRSPSPLQEPSLTLSIRPRRLPLAFSRVYRRRTAPGSQRTQEETQEPTRRHAGSGAPSTSAQLPAEKESLFPRLSERPFPAGVPPPTLFSRELNFSGRREEGRKSAEGRGLPFQGGGVGGCRWKASACFNLVCVNIKHTTSFRPLRNFFPSSD